jgi:hypothetical protein
MGRICEIVAFEPKKPQKWVHFGLKWPLSEKLAETTFRKPAKWAQNGPKMPVK